MNVAKKNVIGLVATAVVEVASYIYRGLDKFELTLKEFSIEEKRSLFMSLTGIVTFVLFFMNMFVGGLFLLWTSYMYNKNGHLYTYIKHVLNIFIHIIGGLVIFGMGFFILVALLQVG